MVVVGALPVRGRSLNATARRDRNWARLQIIEICP